jgi:hypothetical protein
MSAVPEPQLDKWLVTFDFPDVQHADTFGEAWAIVNRRAIGRTISFSISTPAPLLPEGAEPGDSMHPKYGWRNRVAAGRLWIAQ